MAVARHDGREEHVHQCRLDLIAHVRLVSAVQIIQQDEHAEVSRDRGLVDVQHRQVGTEYGLFGTRKCRIRVEHPRDGPKGMSS